MALTLADRVKETTTTTGTGTIDLDGAAGKHQTFVSGVGGGSTTLYAIVHQSADEWEVGEGTVTDASPDTLSRDTVLDSTNGGSKVSFSAGTKDVLQTFAADRVVLTDVAVETDVNETITGAWTFNADVTLGMATQNWKFAQNNGASDNLAIVGGGTDTNALVHVQSGDNDATEFVGWVINALGSPAASDHEAAFFRYNPTDDIFEVQGRSGGTGTPRPLHVYTEGTTNQIVARTDGNVAMSGSLKVGGTGAATRQLDVVSSSGIAFINVDCAAASNAGLEFREAGTQRYLLDYRSGQDVLRILTYDSDGAGTSADVIRIPDGQVTVDFNATADENAFDEYEDYKLARAARVSMMPTEAELRQRHADLLDEFRPVLERSGMVKWDEDGTPFIGMQKMMMFQLDGLFQVGSQAVENRNRIEKLEAENERLRNRLEEAS